MSSSILRYFSILGLIFLIQTIILYLQLPDSFELGVYGAFTLSMLKHGDLNIITELSAANVNWLVTPTYNHPSFEHPTVSIFLMPFFLYQVLVNWLTGNATPLTPMTMLPAHIMAFVSYTIVGFVFLFKSMKALGLKYIKTAIFVLSFSTPFLWYSLFASTNTNSISLVYSIMAFSYFLIIHRKPSLLDFVFLAALSGLGLCFRIELFWIFSLWLVLLLEHSSSWFKKALFSIVAALIPILAFSLNTFLRTGRPYHPLGVYLRGYHLFDFFFKTLSNSFFGPNGYLVVSPIYTLILIGFLALFIRQSQNRRLYLFLFLCPLFLFLTYNTSWALMDELVGRHQLDYFLMSAIFLCGLFDYFLNKPLYMKMILWIFVGSFVLWHVFQTLAFFCEGDHTWQWIYHNEIGKIPRYFDMFLFPYKNSSVLEKIKTCFYFLPLMAVLSFLIVYLLQWPLEKTKPVLIAFFSFGIVSFLVFSALNYANNWKNASELEKQGFFSNKVVGTSDEIFFYDDYIEEFKRVQVYYLKRDDCQTVRKLKLVLESFLLNVVPSITKDPVGFKNGFSNGQFPPSHLEAPELTQTYEREIASKCLF